jgi:hypothetical protein
MTETEENLEFVERKEIQDRTDLEVDVVRAG